MKIGPSGFCMPVSNGYTALRREAVFKKSPTLPAPMLRRGFTLWVLPEAPRGALLFNAACISSAGLFAQARVSA